MRKIILLSAVVFQLLVFFSIGKAASGIGGSGGGPSAGTLVTVEVCGGGDSGSVCQVVSYKIRAGKALPVLCRGLGDSDSFFPCPSDNVFPNWLRKLNEAYSTNIDPRANEAK